MACKTCEERRAIVQQAKAKDGVKGVVYALPKVASHFIRHPPIVRNKPKG